MPKGRSRPREDASFSREACSFNLPIIRYLRAQKWDLATAIIKLEASITWRRENGLADDDGGERPPEEGGGLNAALVKEEGRCGKE